MSAPGPESIPTSADPRSKRPVKKRALSPLTSQSSSITALFSKPDQSIHIPKTSIPLRQRPRVPVPPEIVTNVQGSSAGAGSGEFHVYKASRRREYERLRIMDEDLKKQNLTEAFLQRKTEHEERDLAKTRKNREKREKKRLAREKAKDGASAPRDADCDDLRGSGRPALPDLPEETTGRDVDMAGAAPMSAAPPSGGQFRAEIPELHAEGLLIHDEDE